MTRTAGFVLTLMLAISCGHAFSIPSLFNASPSKIADKADYPNDHEEAASLIGKYCAQGILIGCLAFPQIVGAVSGGGLDYANLDITGQDFSNGNYKGKDFTQVIAKGTNFKKSNLQGCRFYKAYLVNADFSGADLRGAALEDTSMDGANLNGAIAAGSYFGQSLLDVESLENADFTDASIPLKTLPQICERPDVKGTNPATGVDTLESLMCP
ncbi:pathogenesis [Seminavis robusta]|uniref:Pathogenesis n=1 Tax=Seminavis robusta TaxID=568900 RepID=A0A9N8DWR5_9STRA|nr:pathogenesis [Seminavis robusta]|eukprot:Sro352_g124290.1 pathogenesis (213) ;mRNA; r:51475-52281